MNPTPSNRFAQPITLLEFLRQHGWQPSGDSTREEVAGLCPLHHDTHPSFYVNRRKEVFYCHGCGRGGGLSRLAYLLGSPPPSATVEVDRAELLEQTCRFHENQLLRFEQARNYLANRGISDRAVVERMRIGYAPGACLRSHLERLGYSRKALLECGLVDERGRDRIFGCVTFPLPQAENLYGRSLANGICRHRFLPGSKGGLYGWTQALGYPQLLVVEGLFDVAALWQAGFPNAVAALGSYLNNRQLIELCQPPARPTYICFDADRNGNGQRAAQRLSVQLRHGGVEALRVELPMGHDPASLFAAGAVAADLHRCLERARP